MPEEESCSCAGTDTAQQRGSASSSAPHTQQLNPFTIKHLPVSSRVVGEISRRLIEQLDPPAPGITRTFCQGRGSSR